MVLSTLWATAAFGAAALLITIPQQCAAKTFDFRRWTPPGADGQGLEIRSYASWSSGMKNRLDKRLEVTAWADLRYLTTVTINDVDFEMILDTGSTDAWVAPINKDLGPVEETDVVLEMLYSSSLVGVNGTLAFATMEVGDLRVDDQAFLHVRDDTLDITQYGMDGLLGLSFDDVRASRINNYVMSVTDGRSTAGRSFWSNIFAQEPDLPNFLALDLARTLNMEDISGGSFYVGEYAARWSAVKDAPKLPRYPAQGSRWTTLLEGISLDGRNLSLSSQLEGTPRESMVALIDTGDPRTHLPSELINQIYSRIPGAALYGDEEDAFWIVPCNTTAALSFYFGGQEFAVHPLDLTFIELFEVGRRRYTVCRSLLTPEDKVDGTFDLSLGVAFLRNVYSVWDFGDDQPDGSTSLPYMQFLSQTDAVVAAREALRLRELTMRALPNELPPARLVELLEEAEEAMTFGSDGDNGGAGGGPERSGTSSDRMSPFGGADRNSRWTSSLLVCATTLALYVFY